MITHGKWCLSMYVCNKLFLCHLCVNMCIDVQDNIYLCLAHACSLVFPKGDSNPVSAVLSCTVINHAATLNYVPLLVALSFIFGGKNITVAQLWGEVASVPSIHIAF